MAMQPRKRQRPYTRQEWNDRRDEIEELYQAKGKKLSEVMEIMQARGFIAK